MNVWRAFHAQKKKPGEEKKYSASVAPRICCVGDKSRSGNLQIAKRTGIRIHVDDDGNVNTYTRNDVATHVPVCNTSARLAAARPARCAPATEYTQYTYLRRCGYIFYKTFLIPRRITGETRKGWCTEVTQTRRTRAGRRREKEIERTHRGGGGKREEGEGTVERVGGKGREERREKGEPEHFVKQGKMRLRRGTTAAFLSLQNYVFRGPPPYLSKHNKFPLCLPFLLSALHSLPSSLLSPFSPRVSATGTRLSFFHTGVVYPLLVYSTLLPYPSVSVCPHD